MEGAKRCNEADTVYQIMQRMTEKRFRHLPVVEGGRLIGIISIGDVVKHRLRRMEFETEELHQYVLSRVISRSIGKLSL